jgi:hypothetical protein
MGRLSRPSKVVISIARCTIHHVAYWAQTDMNLVRSNVGVRRKATHYL